VRFSGAGWPERNAEERCTRAPFRKIARDINEEARDHARSLKGTPEFEQSSNERKKVEMRFAHLKVRHGFERMRLRGLGGNARKR
jgi:Transposase DDE domain